MSDQEKQTALIVDVPAPLATVPSIDASVLAEKLDELNVQLARIADVVELWWAWTRGA